MKILITGSSGFVGKYLVKKLSTKHVVVRYDLKTGQNVLDEKLLLSKLKSVDVVIHLAAFISAEESWKRPKEYFVNNSLGTLSVIRNSIKAKVKIFLFFSSAAVKARPLTPYAISKISSEKILKLYSNDINVITIRPENIYGAGQKESYGYVIHNFIKAIKHNRPVQIYGDGLQVRDFIYIEDVVNFVNNLLMIREIKSGTTISLGSGRETKIIDLAKLVGRIIGNQVKIEFLPKRKEPRKSVADIKTLYQVKIDANKFIGLKEGIQKLIKIGYSNDL